MVKLDAIPIVLAVFLFEKKGTILKSRIARKVKIFFINSKNKKIEQWYHLGVCEIWNEKLENSTVGGRLTF